MEGNSGARPEQPSSRQAADRFIADIARLYWKRLYVYVAGLTGSSHDAEDIAQEVLLRAHKWRRKFAPEANVTPWLYKVATNLCRKRLRTSRRRRELAAARRLADRRGPADELAIYETDIARERVRQALELLPNKYKEPIYLRYMEQLKYAEIAEVLGTSLSAVASRIHRGKQMLRGLLSDLGGP